MNSNSKNQSAPCLMIVSFVALTLILAFMMGFMFKINSSLENFKEIFNNYSIESNLKFAQMNSNLTQMSSNLTQIRTAVDANAHQTNMILERMDSLEEKIMKTNLFDRAELNSIFFSGRNSSANAVLIKHPNLGLAVATNIHVVFNETGKCFEKKFKLHFRNYSFSTEKFQSIYSHNQEDLAIIKPIFDDKKFEEELKLKAAEIETGENYKGIEIFGSCFYRGINVYNHGKVVEYREIGKRMIFQSDIGGTFGFSGCGYYNLNGKLAFIHTSSGNFHSELEDNLTKDSPLLDELSLVRNEVGAFQLQFINFFKSWEKNKTIAKDKNLHNFYTSVHKISRNPRTKVTLAKNLLNLSDFDQVSNYCD